MLAVKFSNSIFSFSNWQNISFSLIAALQRFYEQTGPQEEASRPDKTFQIDKLQSSN
jgi:hypothetical protein